MSTQSDEYYWLTCDWPGCNARSTDGGEYGAWDDVGQAVSEAQEYDWYVGPEGDFCSEHSLPLEEPNEDSPEWDAWDDANRRRPRPYSLEAEFEIVLERVGRKIDRAADRAVEGINRRVRDWARRDEYAAMRAAREKEMAHV